MEDRHSFPITYRREDLIRILNQSLRSLGFELSIFIAAHCSGVADSLQEISHVPLESPDVVAFRSALHDGNWDLVESACFIFSYLLNSGGKPGR